MRTYDVWIEGYAATGERSTAEYVGLGTGESFPKACLELITRLGWPIGYYSMDSNDFWGRRFFDNEKDARKFMG